MQNRSLIATSALAGALLLGLAQPARADDGMLAQGLAAGLALAGGCLAVLAILLARARARIRSAWLAADAAVAGLVRWKGRQAWIMPQAARLLALPPGPAKGAETDRMLAGAIGGGDRPLAEALAALHGTGAGFRMRVTTASGVPVELRGERRDGADLLWLVDLSEAVELSGRLAAMTEQEANLRAVLDALPMPVWWRDKALRIAGFNRAYAAAVHVGTETAATSGRELGAGYIDRDGRALAERAAQSGMPQSESHHVVIGSSRRLLEFTEAPIGAERGRIAGFAMDSTALEALQDQMADHIAAHADVLEGLSTAIAIFGADRRLKFSNAAYAKLTGIDSQLLQAEPSMGEVLEWQREHRRLPEYIDFPGFKADRNRWFTALIEPVEELLHLPDQTTIRSVASPHPLGGIVFAMEDVTDRLALESSYNTLIEVQRETLNNLHEGVAVFGGDGRLKLSNPELARIWNVPENQFDGGPHVIELIDAARGYFAPDAEWVRLKQRLVLMVTERRARSGRLRRTDNSVIRYAIVPLPDGNTLASFLDVTDSAQVEEALRGRYAALEAADRIKSEFIGNVSYELRTPLNAIVGFTEILDNRYFGDLTERQAEYIQCILQASTHLMTLIDDILDLATVEAGYMALDVQPVAVRGLLEGLMQLATDRAGQAGLTIVVKCPKNIGTLSADPVRLRQAMFNLVSNAIQFTPAGGQITLSAEREDSSMLLMVSDTGIGIAPEDQARVFEKFERGEPNARESGAGLGLALVKSLIELHGGTVTLESAPGQGTRAICRLPLGGAEAIREHAASEVAAD